MTTASPSAILFLISSKLFVGLLALFSFVR